jgi:peptide/nickel transport system substrate-binding protein
MGIVLSGCASLGLGDRTTTTTTPAVRGGELRVAIPEGSAITWDPRSAVPMVLRVAGPAVMATLMRPEPTGGAPTPWLAESVSTDATGRTWTIVLRPGLRFADGAALTARDIAFTLTESAADPVLGTRFGVDDDGPYFTSAEATAELTLVVQLRRANAALDRLVLAAPEFGCVRDGYAGLTREEYFARPVACGPFAIDDQVSSTDAVRLVRNPTYVDAAYVLPDAVALSVATDVSADVDLAVGPSAFAGTLRQEYASPPGVTPLLVMRSTQPTRDTNLRQALRAALDPDAMVAAAPGAVPASTGLTPVGWPGAIPVPVPGDRTDIARTALALVPADRRSVDLLVRRGDPVAQRRAESIVASARSVGLDVTVRSRSQDVYDRALSTGAFQSALVDVAPTVAHVAELSRRWAWTAGFGGGWPSGAGERAYPGQLADAQSVADATARFEDVMRRGVFVVPLAYDVHRAVALDGVSGVTLGTQGSLPLELVSVPQSAPATANSIGPTDP